MRPRFANKILKAGSPAAYMSPRELAAAVETRTTAELRCHPLLHLCLAHGKSVSRNNQAASDLSARLAHANLALRLSNAEPSASYFVFEVGSHF